MVNTLCVVIPFYNEKPAIIKCLQALANIELHIKINAPDTTVEWLFVDGQSTDGSGQLIEKLGYRCIRSTKGRAVQMNTGAKYTNARWLIFLHVDTLLNIDFASHFSQLPSAAQWGYFTLTLSCERPIYTFIARAITWRTKIWRFITGDQTLFIRRTYFESMGGFADIALMEDVEFSQRLFKKSQPVCLPSQVTTSARKWQNKGVFKTVIFMWWIQIMYRLKVDPKTLHRWYYANHYQTKPQNMAIAKAKTCIVAQFAKAPLDNFVKTRLSSVLNEKQRLNLHQAMIEQVLDNTEGRLSRYDQMSGECSVLSHQLWVSHKHAYFETLARRYSTRLCVQKGQNLGDKLIFCIKKSLPVADHIILIGSDCVSLTPKLINQVNSKLITNDVVIIPATDGGFVLLALSCWRKELFDDITWGQDLVFKTLLDNVNAQGLCVYCFTPLPDIDRPEDLSSLPDAMRSYIT